MNSRQLGTTIIGVSSMFLVALIALSVIFVVNATKYEPVFGTVMLERNEKGKRQVSVLYVIDGSAFVEPLRSAPREWEDDELVEFEYHQDDYTQIRVRPSVVPYVIGFLFFGSTLAAGFMIKFVKKAEEE